MEKRVIDEGKGIAWLSYLGILLLIPLLTKRENEYVKFHLKQGIVLLILSFGWSIIQFVFLPIPVLGVFIHWGMWIFILTLTIIGIINSLSGRTEQLPVIGKYGEKINI